MATTSIESAKGQSLPHFVEHDKLGPLGARHAVLDNDLELRRALVAEFAATAAAAREAAGSVDRGASDAVHAYRKALRRSRAVLSLVAHALPKSERRAVKRALREARRALSPARDQVVAPNTLGGLALDDSERATAKQIVDAALETAQPVVEIKQLLAEGAARAAAQVEALEAALPPTISWEVVARGLRDVYDEARCARTSAKRSKRSFHAWRRRSKELSYQLDILATYAGQQVDELRSELNGAIDPQSPAVDLIMVRDFIRTFGQGIDAEACDRLLGAIDAQLDDLMKAARKAGKGAFKRSPRRFARRLTKAVRRDLAPVPPADAVA